MLREIQVGMRLNPLWDSHLEERDGFEAVDIQVPLNVLPLRKRPLHLQGRFVSELFNS